ncbi:MAG TPA: (2Fe-2S)-binding protein [Steroidobacteraceae bacterium]|jgi:xanthine dehydrogenase YagT iron-sulfur-binding subunit
MDAHPLMPKRYPANARFSRTRRFFLQGAASGAATLPLAASAAAALAQPARADRGPDTGAVRPAPAGPRPGEPETVTLRINGQSHTLSIDPRTTLLDALRDHAGLTGTKKGCGHGQCGACTVHVDGQRFLSCMAFAVTLEGRSVTTIEGLAGPGGQLHPMQQAFIDHDAFQCGYCTPGQIMSAIACVEEGHADTPGDIREYMSGNLCRCAAYPNIVAAIQRARQAMKGR